MSIPRAWARVRLVAGRSTAELWDIASDVPLARIDVGSAARCAWRIDAAAVAPHQLELFWDGQVLWAADLLGTRNVLVNGDVLDEWRALVGRCRLQFGQAAMVVDSSARLASDAFVEPSIDQLVSRLNLPSAGPVVVPPNLPPPPRPMPSGPAPPPRPMPSGAALPNRASKPPDAYSPIAPPPQRPIANAGPSEPTASGSGRPAIGIGATGVAHTSFRSATPTPKPPPPSPTPAEPVEPVEPPVERSHFEAPPPAPPPKPRFGVHDLRNTRITLPLRTWIMLAAALPLCVVGLVIIFYRPPSPVPPRNPLVPDGSVTQADAQVPSDAAVEPSRLASPMATSNAPTEAGQAADLLVRGHLPEALLRYEHLLTENPRNESYAAMVKILGRRLRERCENEPTGLLCNRYR